MRVTSLNEEVSQADKVNSQTGLGAELPLVKPISQAAGLLGRGGGRGEEVSISSMLGRRQWLATL